MPISCHLWSRREKVWFFCLFLLVYGIIPCAISNYEPSFLSLSGSPSFPQILVSNIIFPLFYTPLISMSCSTNAHCLSFPFFPVPHYNPVVRVPVYSCPLFFTPWFLYSSPFGTGLVSISPPSRSLSLSPQFSASAYLISSSVHYYCNYFREAENQRIRPK